MELLCEEGRFMDTVKATIIVMFDILVTEHFQGDLFRQSIPLVLVAHRDSHLAGADDDVGVPGPRINRAVRALQATLALLHIAPELSMIDAASG